MYKIMLALHLVFAIFAIGPLIHATTTASRGLRTGDAGAVATSSKSTRIYSYASFLAVIFGFGLMSSKYPWNDQTVASFSEPWIWISLILWFVAIVVALIVVVPALDSAVEKLKAGESASALIGKVAGSGGVIALLFLATVFLMVYKPGA
ncbi:DUF2269 family protein [Tomitella gaofuii]|uniref:DUF2269 family protein n=1 Tax=Tomitella gaofuii TaxID=2760083 RepID=UPI0015F7EFE6|nr:DUF2269 family protein [Tomitella gaofuii]